MLYGNRLPYAPTCVEKKKANTMKRVSIKEEACIGCGLCQVYCTIEHSKSKDPIKAYLKEYPKPEKLPNFHLIKNELIEKYPKIDTSDIKGALERNSGLLETFLKGLETLTQKVENQSTELHLPETWEGTPWQQLEKTNKLLEENLKVNQRIAEKFFK